MAFTAEKIGDFCAKCTQPIVPGDRVAGGPHPKPLFHEGCWPTESQAPRQTPQAAPASAAEFEFELSSKRDPRPERRVVKVICPRGTTATQQARVMQRLEEFVRVSDPRG